MEVIIQPTPEHAANQAAVRIAQAIRRKPALVLGLATGSTPLRLYDELVRMNREEGLDLSRITTFNLDEYLGLPATHPASYRRFMQEHFFDRTNINPQRTFVPDGMAADIPRHCREYEERIKAAGGIDIQVLGIGSDGHIGFNEPTSSLASRTRDKVLTEQTRRDNARFFQKPEDVPYVCLTMGIGTILDSRLCLLLAFGAHKAEAVAAAVEGPLTSMIPASALQLHADAKVFVDVAAAAKLKLRDYYDYAVRHSP
ncbi:MAG: glucosamine-6-phosphate deaminase [Kiritimatiellia bacterium]